MITSQVKTKHGFSHCTYQGQIVTTTGWMADGVSWMQQNRIHRPKHTDATYNAERIEFRCTILDTVAGS